MNSPAAFNATCVRLLERMINTVLRNVTLQLTDAINLLPFKVSSAQFTIQDGQLLFDVLVRVSTLSHTPTNISSLQVAVAVTAADEIANTTPRSIAMYWCDARGPTPNFPSNTASFTSFLPPNAVQRRARLPRGEGAADVLRRALSAPGAGVVQDNGGAGAGAGAVVFDVVVGILSNSPPTLLTVQAYDNAFRAAPSAPFATAAPLVPRASPRRTRPRGARRDIVVEVDGVRHAVGGGGRWGEHDGGGVPTAAVSTAGASASASATAAAGNGGWETGCGWVAAGAGGVSGGQWDGGGLGDAGVVIDGHGRGSCVRGVGISNLAIRTPTAATVQAYDNTFRTALSVPFATTAPLVPVASSQNYTLAALFPPALLNYTLYTARFTTPTSTAGRPKVDIAVEVDGVRHAVDLSRPLPVGAVASATVATVSTAGAGASASATAGAGNGGQASGAGRLAVGGLLQGLAVLVAGSGMVVRVW
ncbi:hypothetical protein BJ912DRAFT_1143203 [Pholiota molesta]|nr:hypothetical protein BJ912DRAFT_1143203 [Pholiota molesta]